MSARRRRFNVPSPVEFGPLLFIPPVDNDDTAIIGAGTTTNVLLSSIPELRPESSEPLLQLSRSTAATRGDAALSSGGGRFRCSFRNRSSPHSQSSSLPPDVLGHHDSPAPMRNDEVGHASATETKSVPKVADVPTPPQNPTRDAKLGDGCLSFPSELCCPVCLDRFHTPVTLSCSHNVCHDHILDLAAAVAPGGVLSRTDASLKVQCPKCRELTVFAAGMNSVHVNLEMKALVDLMVAMLSQTHQPLQQSSTTPPPPPPQHVLSHRNNGDSSDVAGMEKSDHHSAPSSLRVKQRRSVRFTGEEILSSEETTAVKRLSMTEESPASASPQIKRSDEREEPPVAGADGTPGPVASARKLEQQLRQQRERLREDREKQAKEKLDEFKRQRRLEIERRKLEAERSEALLHKKISEELGQSPPSVEQQLRPGSRGVLSAVLVTNSTLQGIKSRSPDDDEAVTSQKVQQWLEEDFVGAQVEEGAPCSGDAQHTTDVVARHLQQLQEYESAGLPGAVRDLTLSEKARHAEQRIQHLFQPQLRSAEERRRDLADRREEARKQRELNLLAFSEDDEEVESRLWDVERRVLRQCDEEMSRSQMAEIAEARARAQIAAFRKKDRRDGVGSRGSHAGRDGGGAAAPTYIPKLHRVQKF